MVNIGGIGRSGGIGGAGGTDDVNRLGFNRVAAVTGGLVSKPAQVATHTSAAAFSFAAPKHPVVGYLESLLA